MVPKTGSWSKLSRQLSKNKCMYIYKYFLTSPRSSTSKSLGVVSRLLFYLFILLLWHFLPKIIQFLQQISGMHHFQKKGANIVVTEKWLKRYNQMKQANSKKTIRKNWTQYGNQELSLIFLSLTRRLSCF